MFALDKEGAFSAKRGRRRAWVGSLALALLTLLIVGQVLPARMTIPVAGAGPRDWNADTFWYHPWGASGVHKGIDIFADRGTPLLAASDGLVLYSGQLDRGGLVVLVLGAKWRLHYFAHLDRVDVEWGDYVSVGERIGSVGATGNARGKPAHVHYSVRTLIPDPRRWSDVPQGWKRTFFLDPGRLLNESARSR